MFNLLKALECWGAQNKAGSWPSADCRPGEKSPKPSSDSTSPWRIWTPKAWSLMIAAKQPVNEANNFIKGNLLPLQTKKKNVSFQFPPQKNWRSCDIYAHAPFKLIKHILCIQSQPLSTRHWSTLPNQLSNSSAPCGDQRPKTVAMLIWWNGLVADLVCLWVNGSWRIKSKDFKTD